MSSVSIAFFLQIYQLIESAPQLLILTRNRQLPALSSTEGMKKVEIMAERLKDINPEIKLHLVAEYLTEQATIDLLHAAKYDYVIDAIDTL